ncbi:MAG: tetratricopeptide repeat protein [Gemmataceae bacterium]
MDCRKALVSGVAAACLLATGCVTTPTRNGGMEHNARTIVAFGDLQAAGGFAGESAPEKQGVLRHEAQLAYLEAMKVDPRYLPAYLGLARLHKANGDLVAAVGTYQQALQLEERNAGLWHEVGMTQCKLRQWDAGIESLKKAAGLDPANGQYRSALGCSLVMAGKPEEGFGVLAQAGGPAKAHLDMAKLLGHQGNQEQARLHLAEATRLDPALPGLPRPAADESPRGEIMQAGYAAAAPPAPGAAPTIIQAGVVQKEQPEAAAARVPIDLPPLPTLSIRTPGK